jgi:hypothetical protein
MITKQLKGILFLTAVLGVVGVSSVVASPAVSRAQTSASVVPCDFTGGNLEIGVVSEEVRCLQKYLNNNGFKIAEIGVGSPGSETSMYGSLTAEAVKRWQMARTITPTGTFGPLSKAEYLKQVASILNNQLSGLTGSNTSTISPVPAPTVPHRADTILKSMDGKEIRISKKAVGRGYRDQMHIEPLVDFDISMFSKEELLMLEEIASKWEKFSGSEMKAASHGEAPWIATRPNEVIDYNLAYYRNKYGEMEGAD